MGIPIYDYDFDEDEISSTTSSADTTTATSSCCSNCFNYNMTTTKNANINKNNSNKTDNNISAEKVTSSNMEQEEEQKKNTSAPTQQHQSHQHHTKRVIKNLVGNGKEYRIDGVNKYDLCIIGNGNRVRITTNVGNVQIIGNATRLKINSNSGFIKYTGNDGRILLGNESTQQFVEYVGCNGILKVCNSTEWSAAGKKHKSHKADTTTTDTANNKMRGCTKGNANGNASKHPSSSGATVTTTATTIITQSASKAPTTTQIPKSASYAGMDWSDQWTHIKNSNNSKNISMPNLGQMPNGFHCNCCHHHHNNNNNSNNYKENEKNYGNINIVHKTIGSIVIKNAVNITI